MQFNSEQFKKILMAIQIDEIEQLLKKFMLENNYGYAHFNCMLSYDKRKFKMSFRADEDSKETFSQN